MPYQNPLILRRGTMNHLVLGSGNMGKRHGQMLHDMGDHVQMVDLGFDPVMHDYTGVDSVLICTPAETHCKLINQIPSHVPVFCEKPIVSALDQFILPRKVSMAACNWNYCSHIRPLDALTLIDIGYPNAHDAYGYLDLIHFAQMPEVTAWGSTAPNSLWLTVPLRDFDVQITVRLQPAANTKYTHLRYGRRGETDFDTEIHESACNMFTTQMDVWRQVVAGKKISPNCFEHAELNTRRLIRELKK